MRRVYVLNKSGHDYSPAEEFGQLIFVTNGRYSRMNINKIYRDFAEKLADSDKDDLLLLTGLPVMQGIAMAIMAVLHGKVNILVYKGGKGDDSYVERNLVIDALLPQKQDCASHKGEKHE